MKRRDLIRNTSLEGAIYGSESLSTLAEIPVDHLKNGDLPVALPDATLAERIYAAKMHVYAYLESMRILFKDLRVSF